MLMHHYNMCMEVMYSITNIKPSVSNVVQLLGAILSGFKQQINCSLNVENFRDCSAVL